VFDFELREVGSRHLFLVRANKQDEPVQMLRIERGMSTHDGDRLVVFAEEKITWLRPVTYMGRVTKPAS
jgi:hypothetical protein